MPVQGYGREPFVPAHDVGDRHQVVVYHVCQVVGRPTVAFEQDSILQSGVVEGDVPANGIVKRYLPGLGHGQANHPRPSVSFTSGSFLRRQVAAATVVAGVLLASDLGRAHVLQFRRRAVAAIGFALFLQPVGPMSVDIQPFGLEIRAIGAADLRAFVPIQPEPAQTGEDVGQGVGYETAAVGVLDAEDELAAGVAGVEPVEEGRAGAADVQVAGGAGGKTDAGGGGSHELVSGGS